MATKHASSFEIVFIRIVAVIIGASVVFATWICWPIPHLGFYSNPYSHVVEEVVPGGIADQASLRVGDTILSMYGRPMVDVIHSIQIVTWYPPRPQPVPMIVERAGVQRSLALERQAPDWSFQAYKGAVAVLALTCWITGYVLGVVRRHTAPQSPIVSLYWLGMSGLLGYTLLAQYASMPLLVVILWLLVAVFLPIAVYIHRWYPPRTIRADAAQRAYVLLVTVSLVLNCSFVAVVFVFQLPLLTFLDSLLLMLPIALLVCLGSISWVLYRVHQQAHEVRIKRQVRLIIMACVAVPILWVLLAGLPSLAPGDDIVGNTFKALVCALVPFAYLIGSISTNLHHWSRVATRSLIHLVTVTSIATALTFLVKYLPVDDATTALWGALGFVATYRPIYHNVRRVFPGSAILLQEYQALEAATAGLAQTLDSETLMTTLVTGLQTQFGAPAYAVFLGDIDGTNALTLHGQQRMEGLPSHVPSGTLTQLLRDAAFVSDSRTMRRLVGNVSLTIEEQQIVHEPAVALWCVIYHSQGYVLGVILLGMRGDLDPYTEADIRALKHLMSAASLAFTNSTAYMQQRASEELIHMLYRQTQEARDAAASEIARDLHDEVIPVPVLNIQALDRLASFITDPIVRQEVALLVQSEQTVVTLLRNICTQLRPPGIDDPYGLPGVLRNQARQIEARWEGRCDVYISGPEQPVAHQIQWEAFRITREALHNAVQHANASQLCIHLQYPLQSQGMLRLIISDNGRSNQRIEAKPNHWGVLFMRESARSVSGSLNIQRQDTSGHSIVFTVPLRYTNEDEQ